MDDKSPDDVTQETRDDATREGSGNVETELSRDMSLFDITFIGVGAMIGAGVFALTGFAAGLAGPALILAFALNGFVALFTAVSYAELGAAFPEAGGGISGSKKHSSIPTDSIQKGSASTPPHRGRG